MVHDAEVRKKNRTRNIYIVLALFLLVLAIGYHRRMILVRKSKRAIDHEKERSENLLLNILPQEIADELKEKGRAEARNFDTVSILFTDFKGFTRISEQLSPAELVEEINSCFKAFDAICRKYGIEKIKTIGDAYMAAGGLPVPSNESVKNTVLAGLEMMEFMIAKKKEAESEGRTNFDMRLGIHTGSVIAGIVGVAKFQYDIWGDSVNIASQMESSGEVGKVNISQSTWEQIKNESMFKFEARGKVITKSKGEIEMWFVEKI
jgi:class 3 adenylate cyclase